MKKVYNSFFAHVFLTIFFSFVYLILGDDVNFKKSSDNVPNYITYLNLSTTIEAGVGVSSLIPNSNILEIVLIIQQFLSMGLNIIIYWYFTEAAKNRSLIKSLL
jgi:hypothetical protein